ncbi:hypothetical protein QWY16_07805 [Planococcus shenhongbingii]|uniref:hypothetical protein n=1 Tax=Planococcus shenhongbingii TaxID=3058398 RepID=UPI00260658E6|nr:hypothetical protein [Planococcus sp. N016]WKA60001.1 hypothetical protein QWY16_07805 [Planococcus sp. N016]
MKYIKTQNGYALVIVLLLVTLFLSISATFIGGSLNHSKQERTVDTSNQAVASAEMGVVFYTEDFERFLELLRNKLVRNMQDELDIISSCNGCDSTSLKSLLNSRIKSEYISSIKTKVSHMDADNNEAFYKNNTSADGSMNYMIDSAKAKDKTGAIEITLNLKGIAKQGESNSNSLLSVVFDVEVPDSFLVTSNHITFDDVYRATPTMTCDELFVGEKYKTLEKPYECKLGNNQKLEDLITKIKSDPYYLKPVDFRVYTDKYLENVCNPPGGSSNCNSNDFQGISVVVNSSGTTTANMNGLTNFQLYVSGKLIIDGNLNNAERNVMALKELVIRNNIQSLEMTTLVVLGYVNQPNIASFEVGNNISMKSNARICMDIDLIKQVDLESLRKKIKIDNTSSLIYYTSTQDPSHSNYSAAEAGKKKFTLEDAASNSRVKVEPNYSNFLKMCGVTVSGSHTVPNIIDTGFDFDVKY